MFPRPTSRRSILILSSHLCLSPPTCLPPSGFPTKTLAAFLLSPHVLYALLISVFLISSPERYLASSAEHKAPCYVVFSTPVLPHPYWAQISSSATYSRKLSAYVPLSMSATKFHNHTKDYDSVYLKEFI